MLKFSAKFNSGTKIISDNIELTSSKFPLIYKTPYKKVKLALFAILVTSFPAALLFRVILTQTKFAAVVILIGVNLLGLSSI